MEMVGYGYPNDQHYRNVDVGDGDDGLGKNASVINSDSVYEYFMILCLWYNSTALASRIFLELELSTFLYANIISLFSISSNSVSGFSCSIHLSFMSYLSVFLLFYLAYRLSQCYAVCRMANLQNL